MVCHSCGMIAQRNGIDKVKKKEEVKKLLHFDFTLLIHSQRCVHFE